MVVTTRIEAESGVEMFHVYEYEMFCLDQIETPFVTETFLNADLFRYSIGLGKQFQVRDA